MQNNIAHLLKFLFAVLLVPVVIAATYAFHGQLSGMEAHYFKSFRWGVIVYLAVHLFIGEPRWLYDSGHRIVSDVFTLLRPLIKVAPLVVPIYTILLLIAFYFTSLFLRSSASWNHLFMFFIGFTFAMHLIFTAKNLREGDNNAAKPDYFFSMAWIYIVNLFILAMLMDLAIAKFSFVSYFAASAKATQFIFQNVFAQLFLR